MQPTIGAKEAQVHFHNMIPPTMAWPPKLRLGEGATCSVLFKFLRLTSEEEVKEKYPHNVPDERVNGLVAVCAGRKHRGAPNIRRGFRTKQDDSRR